MTQKTIREIALEKAVTIGMQCSKETCAYYAESVLAEYLAQQEPIGHIDAEQLRRWGVLRGTEYEVEERCYMPWSKKPFQTDIVECSMPVFLAPPIPAGMQLGQVELDSDTINIGADELRQALVMLNSGRSYQYVATRVFNAMLTAAKEK